MSDAVLNLDGVQFARIREKIDPFYRALADNLEEAYYHHWKLGRSFDWNGYDPIADPKLGEPKAVFDALHGAIWTQHEAALIEANAADADPYPEDKINPLQDDGRRRAEVLAERKAEHLEAGIDIAAIELVVATDRDTLD